MLYQLSLFVIAMAAPAAPTSAAQSASGARVASSSGFLVNGPALTGVRLPRARAAESLNSGRTASGGGFINNSPALTGLSPALFTTPDPRNDCAERSAFGRMARQSVDSSSASASETAERSPGPRTVRSVGACPLR